ncbi:hypothetical protein [Thiocapsa roseopersicina]|uniref:Trypsin-like peptidase domain-containing protein n=1 Tax=Thiocapsa roseopersicina TaxID=1058 RepID=A0A1H2VP88_THIRO|nr:hypothetical protein [Thiocapsa roseopersicina]SDW69679.1 hypothetical protein SAMN05421783_10793 [Thiocapsa roseopersicina]
MPANFKDLLIEIFVPLADGSGRGRIGTGVPIARNRILTARHVLIDDGLATDADFEIRWHHWRDTDSDAGRWTRVDRSKILFDVGPHRPDALKQVMDAAVFEFTFHPDVDQWCELTTRNHATGTPWESEGFPDVGRRNDGDRVAVPLRGKTYQSANQAIEAWVDVAAPTLKPEDWKGASGCPVIVSSRVAGLLTEVPPGFGGGRIMVLPIRRLLQRPEFREAIGYCSNRDRLRDLVVELQRGLTASPLAVGALECFVEGRPEGGLFRDPARSIEHLAERLVAHDAAHLLTHAREATRLLKKDRPEQARAPAELVQSLIPLMYDPTLVDGLSDKVADPEAVLIGFPVATRCAAEVVMAGAGKREMRFRPPEENREHEGVLSLPRPPNCGIDPHGRRTADAFGDHLRRKLSVGNLSTFERAFYRCMEEFVDPALRSRQGMTQEDVLEMTADLLTDEAEGNSRRYYYLFLLPTEDKDRQACLETIQVLKNRFRAVAFLELADDAALIRGEHKDFLPLRSILEVLEE